MATLTVEKSKIEHNADIIAREAGNSRIIGVVKSNGYGLGLIPFTKALIDVGVDMFAVAELSEGAALRRAGIKEDILLLTPLSSADEVKIAFQNNIIITVASYDGGVIADGIANELNIIAPVHIKVDTGFGRFGFHPNEGEKIINLSKYLKNLSVTGIFTHLSDSFGRKEEHTRVQFDAFSALCDYLTQSGMSIGMRHIANSCAMLRFPYTRLDGVRIGSAYLGRLPIKDKWGFKKVGYLTDKIIEIRWLPASHNVGYGNVFTTKNPTKTAVIPVGYSLGFGVEKSKDTFRFRDILRYMWNDFKSLSGSKRPYALINNHKCRVLGRVGLCSMTVDITDVECQIGDEAIMQINPLMVDSMVVREYE
jgi:alanine racemase